MLCSLAEDFARLPEVRVAVTWDARLGDCPLLRLAAKNIEVHPVRHPSEEEQAFDDLCLRADAVLVIAPETQDLLADRCLRARRLGAVSLNSSVEAIRLCADKLTLADRLTELGIPTIPTRRVADPLALSADELSFPLVIKPRDGAGSQDIYRIDEASTWQMFQDAQKSKSLNEAASDAGWIVQPLVAGTALSIAAIVADSWLEVFPLAEQHLAADGRFGYLGGQVPANVPLQRPAAERVREFVRQIPGLSGYIGFDLLAPQEHPDDLLIVEINPRLTTSYLGYRAIAQENLAEYLQPSERPAKPISWKPIAVEFSADGHLARKEYP